MDEDNLALHAVHDALVQRGFARDWAIRDRYVYLGRLDRTGLNVLVAVELTDFDFVDPVKIRLTDPNTARNGNLPHVSGADGSLCYFERGAVIFDRYNPGGTIVQCLDQAEKVLRDAIRGRLDDDFTEDFYSYWGTGIVLTDLPEDPVRHWQVRSLAINSATARTPVLCHDDSWLLLAHSRNSATAPRTQPCTVVRVSRPLSLDPAEPRSPENLADFNRWLSFAAPSALGELEQSFGRSEGPYHWLAIASTNGLYLAGVELPRAYQKPEFTRSRRQKLPSLLSRIAADVQIDRWNGLRADQKHIFSRNMGQSKNLAGKKILLIGCGTIGGFLAQQLAQSGAGASDGKLVLVDKDKLGVGNLGRHLLGARYLLRNKAEGCRDFLSEQLPMLTVEAKDADGLSLTGSFSRFDLVIDATGEEGVSIALNEKTVRARPAAPPVLFVWLLGNGSAAQSLLTGDPEFACFKCMKPNLGGEPRYRTMKTGQDVMTEKNLSCGDAHYVPFPVSRSVSAAALGCEHALDWANGSEGYRFRSRTLDHARANQVKDANPGHLPSCPACGDRR